MIAPPALKRCAREGCRGALFPEDVRGADGFWRVEWTCFSCSHSPEPPPPFEQPHPTDGAGKKRQRGKYA